AVWAAVPQSMASWPSAGSRKILTTGPSWAVRAGRSQTSCLPSTAWKTILISAIGPYHGLGGPIPVSRPRLATWSPLHGIAPLVNAPGVGQNLEEHLLIALTLQLRPDAQAASLYARQSMCIVRYSSGLAGAGRNDMQIVSAQPVGVDEGAFVRGG